VEDPYNCIRKFGVRANHLDELVVLGTLTALAASFLDACVVAGLNILVAGGTQAGKTTIVNPCAETYVRHIKGGTAGSFHLHSGPSAKARERSHSPCPQPSHHLSPTAMGGRNC
jgi:hypothetical protein